MRLINVASMGMEQFFDYAIPQYAILSHTWGSEEVTFQDFQDLAGAKLRAGWTKIESAMRLTREHHLGFLWVDTCCIDKTSSAELQEAINSMYRWYEQSTVCFAFLSDIRCPRMTDSYFIYDRSRVGCLVRQEWLLEELHIQHNDHVGWPALRTALGTEPLVDTDDTRRIGKAYRLKSLLSQHLTSSRWFTRGWTLQELVAPEDVVFYDSESSFIGLKTDLCHTIMAKTGIDWRILTWRKHIDTVSIAQRMSWAADRMTSRIEDRAYSLLGIFGVSMPMIYGEGLKSFARLQEEIMKTSNDDSIFAWDKFPNEPHRSGKLLAESPREFYYAGDIVAGASPNSFAMTNRGLRIDALLRKAFDLDGANANEFAALLNCHHRDDTRGTLALRLSYDEGSGSFRPVEGSPHSRLSFDQSTKLQPNSRLAFISASNIASCERRNLLIARRHTVSNAFIFKLLLLSGSDYPCSARIIKEYPNNGWDGNSQIFRTTPWDRIRAGVLFECDSGEKLAVVWGYDVDKIGTAIDGIRLETGKRLSIWAHYYHSDIGVFADFCESHVPFFLHDRKASDDSSRFNECDFARVRAANATEALECRIERSSSSVFTVGVWITKLCELEGTTPHENVFTNPRLPVG